MRQLGSGNATIITNKETCGQKTRAIEIREHFIYFTRDILMFYCDSTSEIPHLH
jgi:hypothetical protein